MTLTGSILPGLSDLVVVGLGAPFHESLWVGLSSICSHVVFRWANGEVWAFAAFSRFAQHLLVCLYGCPGFAVCLFVPGAAGPVLQVQ